MEIRVANEFDMPNVYALRDEVFVGEQNVPPELERDEEDAHALHIVATDNGVTVGCARVLLSATDAHIGRVAVKKEWRGQGIGAAVCRFVIDHCRERGILALWLNSQLHAAPFYQKLGFSPQGETFLDAGIEHVRMVMEEEQVLRIRTMTKDDYDSVYDIWIHTLGMGLNGVDDSREGIARYLKRNPNTCFVAIEDSCIVGVILSGHDGRRGFIHHTAVLPQSRHRGIGTELVRAAMDALAGEGITKVALVAFAKNAQGNAFWEAQGFTVRDDLVYRNKVITPTERMDT